MMVGVLVHWRSRCKTTSPSRSGKPRSRMITSGRSSAACASPVLSGFGFVHVITVGFEADLQKTPDRKLVIDQKRYRAIRVGHATASFGGSGGWTSGSRIVKRAPP